MAIDTHSLAPKIWELIPSFLKEETSLAVFKKKTNTWTTAQYLCRLCKKYIERRSPSDS